MHPTPSTAQVHPASDSHPAPPISVVIPAYNRPESLFALLDDLQQQRGVEFEVIVVDDHSPQDPTALIHARFPAVKVLRNPVNSGPAVTRNRGIMAAGGRIIVGFDSDVRVPDSTVLQSALAVLGQNPSVDGLAFRLLAPDGQTDDHDRWWHPVPLARFAHRRFLTSYFSGTAYAFRRDAVVGAGLFPEILFMHYEEVELAYRLLDRGSSILYCPELTVQHHAHPVSRRSEIKVFYKPRNQVLLAIGCLPWTSAVTYLVPRMAYQLFVAVRDGHLRSFGRAMRSAREKAPARWRQRRVLRRSTLRQLALLRHGPTG
jgi:GT2 family glycosyltransferase